MESRFKLAQFFDNSQQEIDTKECKINTTQLIPSFNYFLRRSSKNISAFDQEAEANEEKELHAMLSNIKSNILHLESFFNEYNEETFDGIKRSSSINKQTFSESNLHVNQCILLKKPSKKGKETFRTFSDKNLSNLNQINNIEQPIKEIEIIGKITNNKIESDNNTKNKKQNGINVLLRKSSSSLTNFPRQILKRFNRLFFKHSSNL